MKRKSILLIGTKVFIIFFGIFSIISSFVAEHHGKFDYVLLGSILLVATLFELLESATQKKKSPITWIDIGLESITLVLAIFFLCTEIFDLKMRVLVLIWGILEILDASLESTHLVILSKHRHRFFYVSVICTLTKLTFGIILCIKVEKGLFVHLIILGSLLIVNSIFHIIRSIKEPN